jgi:5-methyltetrahydropteroyltriglutamate--homocysteine methyltransferase
MQRSTDRILTTHTGSLPRPPELAELLVRKSGNQPYDAGELARLARVGVELAVRRQAEAGIDVPNDGEQRRTHFFLYATHRLSGFGGAWNRPLSTSVTRYPEFMRMQAAARKGQGKVQPAVGVPMAVGPIDYVGHDEIRLELKDFRSALALEPGRFVQPFMTAVSPGIVATALKNEYYSSRANYLKAIGEALRNEYKAIADAGFLLQIDSPDLAYERSGEFGGRPLSEFLEFAELVIDTINSAIRDIPSESVRLHVCWGNIESPHDDDVALSDILPILLKANVGALVLPFATGRQAHEYKTFNQTKLPDRMLLVAGVIDTRSNVIEHPEAVADRIERVATVIGDASRVLAGTDCGLSTSAGMSAVASDVAWAKLKSLCEGARIASSRLF